MIENFKGKTAVLTGAGSGFGLECARIGARLGMNLVLVDVQQDRAYVLRAAISPGMRDLFIVARDEVKGIDTEEKLERLVRKVKDTPMAVAGEPALPVELVGMDTGHRTDEVYGARRRCGGWRRCRACGQGG